MILSGVEPVTPLEGRDVHSGRDPSRHASYGGRADNGKRFLLVCCGVVPTLGRWFRHIGSGTAGYRWDLTVRKYIFEQTCAPSQVLCANFVISGGIWGGL